MEQLYYFDYDTDRIKKLIRQFIVIFIICLAGILSPFFIRFIEYLFIRNEAFFLFLWISLIVNCIFCIKTVYNLYSRLRIKISFGEKKVTAKNSSNEREYSLSDLTDITLSLEKKTGSFSKADATYTKYNDENLKNVKREANLNMGDSIFVIFRFNNETLPLDDDPVNTKRVVGQNYFIIEYRENLIPILEEYYRQMSISN